MQIIEIGTGGVPGQKHVGNGFLSQATRRHLLLLLECECGHAHLRF